MSPNDKPPHLKLLAYAVLATLVTLAVLAGLYEWLSGWYATLSPDTRGQLRYALPIIPLALALWLRRKRPRK